MVSQTARVGGRSVSALLLALSLSLAAALPFAGSATAQDDEDAHPLGALTSQELLVRATDTGVYAVVWAPPLVEGWTHVTLENESDSPAVVNFASLPDDVSVGEFSSAVFALYLGGSGEVPDWWGDVEFSGGAWASPESSADTAVYLTPGNWVAFSTNPMSPQGAQVLAVASPEDLEALYGIEPEATPVVGTPEAVVEPEPLAVDGTLTIENGAFSGAEDLAAGSQLVEVVNNSDQVSEVVVAYVDYDIPPDEAVLWVGTFAAGDVGSAVLQNGSGQISPGASAVVHLDLEPGTYVVFSTAPDAEGGLQSANGLTQVVQVGD